MIRRSPAEYYIRYRLLASPRVEIGTLIEELEEDLIFVPSRKYVEKLRRRMNIPMPFRPRSLADTASQKLLGDQRVWSMFHASQGTRQARALLQNLRPRMAIQLLLAASVPDELIVEVAHDHLHVALSAHGLQEFRHYFWNVGLLSRIELGEYIEQHFRDHEMARVSRLPPDKMTTARALLCLGLPPPSMTDREIFDGQRSACAVLGSVYVRELEPDAHQAQAVKTNVETMLILNEASGRDEQKDELWVEAQRFKIATLEFPFPTLAEIEAGTAVPYPVERVFKEHDDEAGEDGEGGDPTQK